MLHTHFSDNNSELQIISYEVNNIMMNRFFKKVVTIALSAVIALSAAPIVVQSTEISASASTKSWASGKLKKFGFKNFDMQPLSDAKNTFYFSVYDSDYHSTYGMISGSGNSYKISLQNSNGKYRQIYPKWRMSKEYGIGNPLKYGDLKLSGNTIRYRKIDNDYEPYGKWYSAKLSSSTQYLKGDINATAIGMRSYFCNSNGMIQFNRLPYLKKKNKSNFVKYVKSSSGWSQCGIKISNGRVKAICYNTAIAG